MRVSGGRQRKAASGPCQFDHCELIDVVLALDRRLARSALGAVTVYIGVSAFFWPDWLYQ